MSLASYACPKCNRIRHFRFDDAKHQQLIEESKNGLVEYSDIHQCYDGMSAVINISVDKNYNIRTAQPLELPKFRLPNLSVPEARSKNPEDVYTLHLTQMPYHLDVHLILVSNFLQIQVKIGRFDHQNLIPFTTISGDAGGIELEVYPTGSSYTQSLERWFQGLIEILETLPPTTLGLLIEAFRYIAQNSERDPTQFDMVFIKTILASHEVFFVLKDPSGIDRLQKEYSKKFTEQEFHMMDKFVRILAENELSPVLNFTSHEKVKMDLVSIIYLFLILEEEGIISIERPGIMDY